MSAWLREVDLICLVVTIRKEICYDKRKSYIVSNNYSIISDRSSPSMVPKIWKSEGESYQKFNAQYTVRIIFNS